jgi:hypothetical protein
MIGLIIILMMATKPSPSGLSLIALSPKVRPTAMPSRTAKITAM